MSESNMQKMQSASDYTPTTEEITKSYVWFRDQAFTDDKLRAEFDRWFAEVSREERDAEREGIMDLLEEMIQQAVQGDDLEGLCLFREALWERNDK